MPQVTFCVKSVSQPERRQHRRTRVWFTVWTIGRQPDDALPLSESLAGYETSNPLMASLCDRARIKGLPVTVVWRESRWLRVISDVIVAKENAA